MSQPRRVSQPRAVAQAAPALPNPFSLGNTRSQLLCEHSWDLALPRLNPLVPVSERYISAWSAASSHFTQQRRLLLRSSGLTSITGAVQSHPRVRTGAAGWWAAGADPAGLMLSPSPADDVHAADGRQVCRRHELYVSFQDLGWLVLIYWEK